MSAIEKFPEITLDEYDLNWAESVGSYRHNESERRGKTQSDGSRDKNAERNHQRGAAGELALTKFLDIEWNATVNTYNRFPDLDGQLECRSKQESQEYLRVYPDRDNAKEDSIFVSVTCLKGDLTKYRIDGWMTGREAMQDKYLKKSHWNDRDEWQPPLSDLQLPLMLQAELKKRLDVLAEGRGRLKDWVRRTLEAKAAKTAGD